MFIEGRDGTRDHVPFLRRASNSAFIAARQAGCLLAWEKQVGSSSVDTMEAVRAWGGYLTLPSVNLDGLKIILCDRVVMSWTRVGGICKGAEEAGSDWEGEGGVFTVGEGDGVSGVFGKVSRGGSEHEAGDWGVKEGIMGIEIKEGVIGTVDVVVGVGVEKGKLFSLKTTCLAI
jgi:hypothetical protein